MCQNGSNTRRNVLAKAIRKTNKLCRKNRISLSNKKMTFLAEEGNTRNFRKAPVGRDKRVRKMYICFEIWFTRCKKEILDTNIYKEKAIEELAEFGEKLEFLKN